MLKKLLFISLFWIGLSTFAQQTYVPDDNFENYLETHNANGSGVPLGSPDSMGNGIANDNYITTANISGVTTLNIPFAQIADLTGIEDFQNLQTLDCSVNLLNSLDVSQNAALQNLYCTGNQLTSLDVSHNTALLSLSFSNNQLFSIDVTHNPNLIGLNCYHNQISSLDVSQNSALIYLQCGENPLTSIDVTHNPALEVLDCRLNQLTSIDVSQNPALLNLNCNNNQITNLDITQNHNLHDIICKNNQLSSLDVSQNPAIVTLWCDENQITNLDVTHNPDLQYFSCEVNQLSSLDVSQNPALITLWCSENQITSLDITQNPVLEALGFHYNQLTSLDMRNGNNINISGFLAIGNPNLTCVYVDDKAYMNANWSNAIDVSAIYVENQTECYALTQTYVPDDNFENYLETHDANGNIVPLGDPSSMGNGIANDNYVTTAKISGVIHLDIALQNIADLTGIEDFTALEQLLCYNNPALGSFNITNNTALRILNCRNTGITSIDISQNTLLENLNCSNNPIANINLTNNLALTNLYIEYTQLTDLDISPNSDISVIRCDNNQLTGLNIANGNNINFTGFVATGNPNLTCVQVDDPTYMNNHWANAIDATASYSIHCPLGETYVPDANFENYLETHDANGNAVSLGDPMSMGNGIANDDYVTTASINTVTSLNVIGLAIVEMTGIEDFTLLTSLDCSGNQIVNLDVSQNQHLTEVYCFSNQITSLVFGNNANLTRIECYDNSLSGFDISQLQNLSYIDCGLNPLTILDVSQNSQLITLACTGTTITQIDISLNTMITNFSCSGNSQLTEVNAANGNNINFTFFDSTNTPNLTCIQVDDPAWSSANWNNIDLANNFSHNCNNPETYVPDDNFENYLENNSMGNGIVNDNYVTTANIDNVLYLDVRNQNISDMTGIQDFRALIGLICSNNQLSNIDVTQNTALTNLSCSHNQITGLDVSRNLSLVLLHCTNNLLTNIDISQNTALVELYCYSNQITGLDVSQNIALQSIYCSYNQLTSLDVSNNPNLNFLWLKNNQLTSLDIRNGNNANILGSRFNTNHNPNLTCIFVDDPSWSTSNWTNIDSASHFVANQADCDALGIAEVLSQELKMYPNPVSDRLQVQAPYDLSYSIMSVTGAVVLQGRISSGQTFIATEKLISGVYFIKFETNDVHITKQLIKE